MVDVAGDGAAAALYVSNIRFAAQATDYLQAELDPSPLLHFWSLGVEEQFYLVWPALLLLVAGRSERPAPDRADGRRSSRSPRSSSALVWTSTDAPLGVLPPPGTCLGAGGRCCARARRVTRLARLPASIATASVAVGLGLIGIGARHLRHRDAVPGHGRPAAGRRRRAGHRRRAAASRSVRCRGWSRSARCAGSAASRTRSTCGTGRCSSSRRRPSARRCRGRSGWGSSGSRSCSPRRAGAGSRTRSATADAPRLRPSRIAGGRRGRERAGRRRRIARGRASRRPAATAARRLTGEVVAGRADDAVPDAGRRAARRRPASEPTPVAADAAPTPPGPVPADLVPPLADGPRRHPIIYADACHADPARDLPPRPASTADRIGSTTVVPPSATRMPRTGSRRWSASPRSGLAPHLAHEIACPVADIPSTTTNYKREYTECETWRPAVLRRIAEERPAMVVISRQPDRPVLRRRRRGPVGGARGPVGRRPWNGPSAPSSEVADHVVVIGDTPNPRGRPARVPLRPPRRRAGLCDADRRGARARARRDRAGGERPRRARRSSTRPTGCARPSRARRSSATCSSIVTATT